MGSSLKWGNDLVLWVVVNECDMVHEVDKKENSYSRELPGNPGSFSLFPVIPAKSELCEDARWNLYLILDSFWYF